MDDTEWWLKFIVSTVLPLVVVISTVWIMIIIILDLNVKDQIIEYKPEYIFGQESNYQSLYNNLIISICQEHLNYSIDLQFVDIKYENDQIYCLYTNLAGKYTNIPVLLLISEYSEKNKILIENNKQLSQNIFISTELLNEINNSIDLKKLCKSTNTNLSMITYDYVDVWINDSKFYRNESYDENCSQIISQNNTVNFCNININFSDINQSIQRKIKVPKWQIKYPVNFCNFSFIDDWNEKNLTFGKNLSIIYTDEYQTI